jgi:hypothetical protein
LLGAVWLTSLTVAKEQEKSPLPPGWEGPPIPQSDRLVRIAIERREIVEIHAKPSRLAISPEGTSGLVEEGKVLPPGYRKAEASFPAKKPATSKGIPRTGAVPVPPAK